MKANRKDNLSYQWKVLVGLSVSLVIFVGSGSSMNSGNNKTDSLLKQLKDLKSSHDRLSERVTQQDRELFFYMTQRIRMEDMSGGNYDKGNRVIQGVPVSGQDELPEWFAKGFFRDIERKFSAPEVIGVNLESWDRFSWAYNDNRKVKRSATFIAPNWLFKKNEDGTDRYLGNQGLFR